MIPPLPRRLLACLALPLAFATSALAQYAETTAEYGKLWFQANELCIKNNTWGKGTLTGYTAKVWKNQFSTTDKYNWDAGCTWSWPVGTGGVKSYQEIVYGYTGGGQYTAGSKLPTWLGAGKNIYIDWSFALNPTGTATNKCNAALDVFLRKDNSSTSSPVETELMIWLNNKGMSPSGTKQSSSVTIGGIVFDIWMNPSITPAGQTASWRYVAYVARTNVTSVTDLNLKSFFTDMTNRGWARSGQNIYAIEAGIEVVQGSGNATHYWFNVDIP